MGAASHYRLEDPPPRFDSDTLRPPRPRRRVHSRHRRRQVRRADGRDQRALLWRRSAALRRALGHVALAAPEIRDRAGAVGIGPPSRTGLDMESTEASGEWTADP